MTPYFSGEKTPPCKITLVQKNKKMSYEGKHRRWKWRRLLRFSLVQVQGLSNHSFFWRWSNSYLGLERIFFKCWGRKVAAVSNLVFSLHLDPETILSRKVKTNTEIMWNNICIQRISAHISLSNRKLVFRYQILVWEWKILNKTAELKTET